jgi:hypothetical protein
MELVQPVQGTCFRILLPVENPDNQAAIGTAATDDTGEPGMAGEPGTAGKPGITGKPGTAGIAGKPEMAGKPGMAADTAAAPARGAS